MIPYIIVQAGGRGSRLETLTANKPKALVPIDNLPMIFHLFKKYPDSKFKIIADYKKNVLKKYLKTFAKGLLLFENRLLIASTLAKSCFILNGFVI